MGTKMCVEDFSSPAIQNAIGVLNAVEELQSPVGAIYYVAEGSLGNSGSSAVNSDSVSLENNFSVV